MFFLRNFHAAQDLSGVCTVGVYRKMFSVIPNNSLNTDSINENHREAVEEPAQYSEEEILEKRNKSRLRFADRNVLHNRLPYSEPYSVHHNSVRYKRKMYGLYGDKSNVDPCMCWPTPEDISDMKEYETVSRTFGIQEMVKINLERKTNERERVLRREGDIASKLANLERWKQEFTARIKKREADAAAAKEKKDQLIEEVRRHFGFKVDPRDDRFKEMVEKKEKEGKKLAKEAKKKEREAKMLAQLTGKSENSDVQNPV